MVLRDHHHEPETSTRRRAIIASAITLFLDHGYAGTSMSQLAQACGIQKATLYHHFPSKEALFIECATDGMDTVLPELEAIRAEASLDDETRFLRALDALYRVQLETQIGRMGPLIAEVSRRIPAVAQAFHDRFVARLHAVVAGIIDDGIARGSFRPSHRVGLQQLIFGPVLALSLEKEMFAAFDGLETLRPLRQIQEEHGALMLQLLRGRG